MKYFCSWLLLILFSFYLSTAQASSSFYGVSTLGFEWSGDLNDVVIDSSGGYVDLGSSAAGDSFARVQYQFANQLNAVFSVDFHVNDSLGSAATSVYQAEFVLGLRNSSNDSRTVSLDLSYGLAGTVSGEYADGHIQLEYGLNGSDELYVDIFGQPSSNLNGRSGLISFTLAPNQTVSFLALVTMTSNVQGTTPVPLPPSFALFMGALFSLRRVFRFR